MTTKASSAPGRGNRARAFRRVAAALAVAITTAPLPAQAAGIVRWTNDGVAVCAAAGNQQNPQIVPDGAGGAFLTWQDRRGTTFDDIYAQRVRADGTVDPGWPANGVTLCTLAFNQTIPQIVSDGAGGAIVVWQDGRSGGVTDIYAQRILPGGKVDPGWPANGVAVCSVSGSQGIPQIASDGAGGAIVTWQDNRGSTADIYAQRVRADGTVDPGWPAGGVALCTAVKTQSNPQIVSDGASGAFVVWHDTRNHGPTTEIYDIYAQRVLAGGAVAPGWPANGVVVCTAISTQLFPEIVSDGAGGAIITWYDRRFGQPIDPIFQDIFAQRLNAAGTPQWAADGVAVCTAFSTQANPEIIPDGAGGAIITWMDHRGSTYDIYAQHVRADGSMDPGWPADGVAVSAAGGSQENPQIVTDGAGGAIITWFNFIPGTPIDPIPYEDIYAQHLLTGGTIAPGWPADGIALCTYAATQQNPQIASDGSGGAIVTWQDARAGGANPQDVYAQRVNDNPCVAPGAGRPSLLSACGVVSWTNAAGGRFSDETNWNGGAGPVPGGTCPSDCSYYDARFGIGGAAYGVDFAGGPTSAVVTVGAGDRAAFHLGGNTYRMSQLLLDGTGSSLTITAGTVAVDGTIQIGPAASSRRGLGIAGAPAGASSFVLVDDPGGRAKLSGGAVPDSIVFGPGAALIAAAPIAYDLANSGRLSPGSAADHAGALLVNASYTQASAGKLVIDLGGDTPGDGYDALRVAGPASLAGALEWKLVGGYVPAIGKEFEVLVAHPRIGQFDSVGEDIAVRYTDTSVVLIATAATPVLASLVSAEAEPGRVRVRWHVSEAGARVTIQRARGTGAWEAVAERFADGTGMVTHEDTDVTSGRYGYRLGLPSDAGESFAGEVWVDVRGTGRFGLTGVNPNPASGPLTVSFSLGDAEPASLELFDLVGRRVASRAIESPRPGERVVTLGGARVLPAGVYLLQLSQGAGRASCRVAVVH